MADRTEYNRNYYLSHREEVKEKSRMWRLEHPEKYQERLRQWKIKHPLATSKAYNLKKLEKVAGRTRPASCEVCGSGGKIMFDHDHATGTFRGWICQHCNSTLGFARDRVEVLYKLISYLNQGRM